ncbi:hypothetical protein CHH57_00200 [Niallia circulans]|jgi:hypothetical protein|uniref:Uncharacterized protein n=1 Tax=Niallia circulans TaxID=1397 RepID=A0AA91Z2T7_NIACI|nr:hypothetical protein [Niallia circulans]PAD85328.1 hypothetical protein CHH57_00200 [Niallia circulans]
MEGILESFLEVEISDQEFYDGIIDFIYNGNIRCGEYECNEFVIRKMDLLNFVVYVEYVIDDKREIHGSFSIAKNKLLQAINEYARKQGFAIRNFEGYPKHKGH